MERRLTFLFPFQKPEVKVRSYYGVDTRFAKPILSIPSGVVGGFDIMYLLHQRRVCKRLLEDLIVQKRGFQQIM